MGQHDRVHALVTHHSKTVGDIQNHGQKKGLKAIDLFAGAGGLSLGLELAGIDVVGAVEYCPKAVKTYKHNFRDHAETTKCEDITKWSPDKMEVLIKEKMGFTKDDIDIIAGDARPAPASPTSGVQKSSACYVMEGLRTGRGATRTLTNSAIPSSKTPETKLFFKNLSSM